MEAVVNWVGSNWQGILVGVALAILAGVFI